MEKQEKEMVVQEEEEKEDIVEEMVVQAEEEKDKEVERDEEEKMVGEMAGAAVERLCADRGGRNRRQSREAPTLGSRLPPSHRSRIFAKPLG